MFLLDLNALDVGHTEELFLLLALQDFLLFVLVEGQGSLRVKFFFFFQQLKYYRRGYLVNGFLFLVKVQLNCFEFFLVEFLILIPTLL